VGHRNTTEKLAKAVTITRKSNTGQVRYSSRGSRIVAQASSPDRRGPNQRGFGNRGAEFF
jgi:hypothetical protein